MQSTIICFLTTRLQILPVSSFKEEIKTFDSWYNFSRELIVLLPRLQSCLALKRLKKINKLFLKRLMKDKCDDGGKVG